MNYPPNFSTILFAARYGSEATDRVEARAEEDIAAILAHNQRVAEAFARFRGELRRIGEPEHLLSPGWDWENFDTALADMTPDLSPARVAELRDVVLHRVRAEGML